MEFISSRGLIEVDEAFVVNPEETIGDLYAVSIPFSNYSRTFVVRARDHEIITALLESEFGDSIKVSEEDIVSATEDFLYEKGYSVAQIVFLKKAGEFKNLTCIHAEALSEYFENSCDFAFDSDLNVWYHSDLIMKDSVEKIKLKGDL